jgi:hypothetical protein
MNAREKLLLTTIKNIVHAADMLMLEAQGLRRATNERDHAQAFAVEQRVTALRRTMDVLTDELAVLKLMDRT